MVFENLTLFELHLENSRFGPSIGDWGENDEDEEASYEGESRAEDEGGRGMGKSVGVFLLLVVVTALAYRRYASGDEGGEGIEEDTDQITIEHATER